MKVKSYKVAKMEKREYSYLKTELNVFSLHNTTNKMRLYLSNLALTALKYSFGTLQSWWFWQDSLRWHLKRVTRHQRHEPPHVSSLCLLSRSAGGQSCSLSSRELRRDGGFTQLSTGIEVTAGSELRGDPRRAAGIRGLHHSGCCCLSAGSGLSSTGDLAKPGRAEHNALPFSHSSHKT